MGWQKEWQNIARLKPFFRGKQNYLWLTLGCSVGLIGAQLSVPLIMEAVVDRGIMAQDLPAVYLFSALFLVVNSLALLLRCGQGALSSVVIQHVIKNFRDHFIHHILWQKPSYHDSEASGNLLTRATSDFDSITDYLNHGVLRAVVDFVAMVGSLFALFLLHPLLLFLGLFAFITCAFTIRLISKWTRSQSHRSRRRLSELNSHSQECLYQQMVIKLYGGEDHHSQVYHNLNRKFRHTHIKVIGYDAFLYSFIDGITSITVGMGFWLLGHKFFGLDGLSAGVMVAFVTVIQQVFDPLKDLGSVISMLQGLLTSLDRILELLSLDQKLEGTGHLSPMSKPASIRFTDVYFRYPTTEISTSASPPWILAGINLEVPLGSSAAIVGETGSGKSTLVKVLSKLYDGYQGSIAIGGHEIRDLDSEGLRKHIAIVSQDLTLFAGTMEWNIHLGRPGMGREQAIAAAKAAGAHEFISAWERGYNEQVLESGMNLSHGQKQLISLCRALCADPEVLILDEATSSIDPVTEKALKHVFTDVIADKTRLIIAHKLSTIRECDQIFVMDRGQIVERGDHPSLMASQGTYHSLIQTRNQLAGENLDNEFY